MPYILAKIFFANKISILEGFISHVIIKKAFSKNGDLLEVKIFIEYFFHHILEYSIIENTKIQLLCSARIEYLINIHYIKSDCPILAVKCLIPQLLMIIFLKSKFKNRDYAERR